MSARPAASAGLLAVLLGAVLVCASCVAPAPTTDAYSDKAGATAASAVSAARTAVLAVQTQQRDSLTAAALEVLLQESELGIAAATETFDSIQPPDTAQADRMSTQLGDLLTVAGDDARWLRIAARRGDQTQLRARAASLSRTADQLADFAEEHGS